MIQVSLRIVAPAGRRDEIVQSFRSLLEPTRIKHGCLSCHFYQDVADENTFTYVEGWQTWEDLERHLRSEQYRRHLALIDLSAAPPELKFHTVSETLGIEYLTAVRAMEGHK
jgi:quinol monooxygenase YgiN